MSTVILIMTKDKQALGAIEKLTLFESKRCPRLELSRMRLSREKFGEAFEDEQFIVRSQKYPVHIVVMEDKTITLEATNVWFSGAVTVSKTDEWILAEGVEPECEYVTGSKAYESSPEE